MNYKAIVMMWYKYAGKNERREEKKEEFRRVKDGMKVFLVSKWIIFFGDVLLLLLLLYPNYERISTLTSSFKQYVHQIYQIIISLFL